VGTPMQTLNAVPDTGSFELMMTAKGCSGCEGHVMFDRHNSTTFMASGTQVDTTFGQGSVSSEAHYDRVQLGSLVADKQSILLMTKNSLRYFNEAAYDAVMGMGRELKARSYSDDLSLMASLRAPVTGVCVGQHDGEPGRLQVGGAVPGLNYVTLPVVGSTHWGIQVDKVSLAAADKKAADVEIPGCGATGCQAIVDSGTSLMALPKTILDQVLAKIGPIKADCSNVDQLPSVRFTAGGHTFDLPPQLYVAKMENDEDASLIAQHEMFKMPWEHSSQSSNLLAAKGTSCQALFMEMNIATSFNGPAMIFGLPFLRTYAAGFDRSAHTVSLGQIPLGSSLCTHCGSSHAPGVSTLIADPPTGAISLAAGVPHSLQPEKESQLLVQTPRERPTLKARHIRTPTWLHRVQKDSQGRWTLSL